MTGSGGSGILIARKSDGTWSPPSGIMLHTPTLSFIIGVDIYDCVLVVSNLSALESITRPRVTLGEDVGLRNGPSIAREANEADLKWKDLDHTVLAYMKAKGQCQSVNLQGCILTERGNENERFYGANVTQMDVLAGNVARHVEETKPLFEVIKMAEGRTDFDPLAIELTSVEPAPGDAIIATPRSATTSPRPSFGIPEVDDPDPFGVLALEMAGLEIREAGSQPRPASSQFEMSSNPLSPTFSKFSRQSVETFGTKSNRVSVMSSRTVKSQMTDAGTQTDVGNTPETTPSPGLSDDGREMPSVNRIDEDKESDEVDYTTVDLAPLRQLSQEHFIQLDLPAEEKLTPPIKSSRRTTQTSPVSKEVATVPLTAEQDEGELEYDTNDADDEDDLCESDDEEPVVFEVAQIQPTKTRAVASRMIHAKGNMVTIQKRLPPPLPTRSPARNSRSNKSDMGLDSSSVLSPLRQAFSEADLRGDDTEAKETTETPAKRISHVNSEADGNEAKEVSIVVPKSEELAAEEHRPLIHSQSEPALICDAKSEPSSEPQPMEELPEQPEAATMSVSLPAEGTAPVIMVEGTREPEFGKRVSLERMSTASTENQAEELTNNAQLEVREPSEIAESAPCDAAVVKVVIAPQDELLAPHFKAEDTESDYASVEERVTEDDESVKTPHEPIDNSDSATSKKHTSSIYTGLTEDRWSMDRSSLTTPTSDRPVSVAEYNTEEDTPKKTAKEDELLGMPNSHEEKTPVRESLIMPKTMTAA